MASTSKDELLINAQEQEWLHALRGGSHAALEAIFESYYRYLVVSAYKFIQDDERAKDLVQDVFFNLWTKRETISIQGSLKSYLRRAVVNRAIDEFRKNKRLVWEEDLSTYQRPTSEASADQLLDAQDLQQVINGAIEKLPQKCRAVFAMSRFENLSHKEIAEQLNISTKTIENQITKALRIIRHAVDQRSDLLLALIFYTLSIA